ncbi:HNH endonuclease family protein [Planomonospora sp. ID82291]|uniref:HNH endonuclease family protein n=1 Tax=Planomonospora sp. ID82291 TaxID=2738136 RepID=UPI0018C40E01|nr:HNH endonuclease family protein [Planomonospora sp. ID82291]MBG0818364.1 HNH endonuclease [Planomonospora sp. ID82291]
MLILLRRHTAVLLTLPMVALASTALPATATTALPQTQPVPADLPEPSPVNVARTELAGLVVTPARPMTGYSRAKFPHWAAQGDGCDTREVVLERDGQAVQRDADCRATSGTWTSLYDDRILTVASQVDIDHVVPLAEGWRSGASAWTTTRRKAFANDLARPQLIAVSAASNRAKGDQPPNLWKPPSRASWCIYARAWVDVKHHYALTVTSQEKTALTEMLDTCRAPARSRP